MNLKGEKKILYKKDFWDFFNFCNAEFQEKFSIENKEEDCLKFCQFALSKLWELYGIEEEYIDSWLYGIDVMN